MIPQKNIPPPNRAPISGPIRELKNGESLFFKGASPDSVKSILTKIRWEFSGRRKFTCAKEDGGVRVWRLA